MPDIPQEEQMQHNMPHSRWKQSALVIAAAVTLTTTAMPGPVKAGGDGGEGGELFIPGGLGGGLQLRPGLFDYGSYSNTPPPVTNNRPGSSNGQPLRVLIPPSFYKRQITMYEKRMQNLEKVGMQNSQAYRSASASHQRAVESYNRALDAMDEDDGF